MELRRIDKAQLIKTESLDKDQYFISVLKKSYEIGLIDQQSVIYIQTGIASILNKLIRSYTCGESSSVKDETASSILCSIYYTIDAYAANLNSPGDLIAEIQQRGITKVYEYGVKTVKSCFDETKKLYDEIVQNKLKIPLVTYNDTIDNALPEFFKLYNIEFSAHETMCSMDYPLAFDDMTIRGVFYIRQYLEKLKLETQFCRCFDQKSISKVIYDYEAKYHMDILSAPINLFEMLFDQLIFSVMSGNENLGFEVSALQFDLAVKKFYGENGSQIHILIDNAAQKIIDGLKISDPKLIDYISMYQIQFTDRFIKAFDSDNLLNMVIVDGDDPYAAKTLFEDGERMVDEDFNNLIDLALQCEDVNEKIKIISANISSVRDYIDLLSADCLYGNEYLAVFETLSSIELAVLGNTVFYEDLRDGQIYLRNDFLIKHKKNIQSEWQIFYIDYIQSISENKKKEIEFLINNLICSNTDII